MLILFFFSQIYSYNNYPKISFELIIAIFAKFMWLKIFSVSKIFHFDLRKVIFFYKRVEKNNCKNSIGI